jgi:hypothetical protein
MAAPSRTPAFTGWEADVPLTRFAPLNMQMRFLIERSLELSDRQVLDRPDHIRRIAHSRETIRRSRKLLARLDRTGPM